MLSQVTADAHTLVCRAKVDVTGSSEENLGDRFSTACPLSVALGLWSHPYGPAELDFPGMVAVRRRGWAAS